MGLFPALLFFFSNVSYGLVDLFLFLFLFSFFFRLVLLVVDRYNDNLRTRY